MLAGTRETRPLLLVDDDEIFAEVLGRALQRRGFEVEIAHDIAAGRQRLAERHPDFALIDLRIGDGSGLSLVEDIARHFPDTVIVVLTGYGSIATAVEAIKLGATQYLTKPADVTEIVAALEGRSQSREALPHDKPPSVRRLEWEHIQKILAEHNGNISATARALGMHRRTLQRKLRKRPVRD